MAKKDKDYDWTKANWWDYPEDDDVEVKEIEIDLDKFLLPKEYAYGGGVGHLLEPTQTYHQYHDFTAPMTVGAMVDNMYNRGGRVNYKKGGWNPGVGRDKKGYQTTSPHHSSRDDGPPSITNPYVPPVVKKPPVQLSDSDVNPMFQHLITPAAAVKTDFLKKHGWYNNPFKLSGTPLLKAGAEAGGYGLEYDKLIGGDLTVGEVLEGMSGGTYDTFDPNVQKTLGEQILGNVDFGDTFQKNWSTDVVEPTIKDGKIDIDETKLEVDEMPVKPKDVLEIKDGGRVGMFMGGDPLTGQALAIYESMNSYGFSDAEIASALQQQGLYTPPGSGTPTPDPTPDPTPGQGGGGGSSDPYPGQIVDQTSFADYQFNKSDYAPGGKLEINPAALGIGFYESGPGKVKDQLPASFVEANKHLTPNQQQDKYYTGKEVGVDYGALEAKKPGFIKSIIDAGVPNKMKSTVTMPGHQQFGPVNPSEFRNFMDANIQGIGGNLTRQDLANMYEDYSKFKGRGSRYKDARVPGTVGNLFGMIPGFGAVKRVGEGIFGPQGDRSMQSTYGVEGGFGGGNTKFRDEFGLSVIDDSKRIFGKRDRNYLDRMEDQMGKNIDFFGGTRTSLFGGKKLDKTGSSVENFAERWANFDDLDAADQQALINEMKAINSFKTKQMLAYKNRIATEKINKDWQQKQEDIATQERIDAEKDFVTQDLGVTAADAATSGRGMDHTRGMTSRERGAAAARMGGGSRQAKSGSQKPGGSGRTDKGWGWAHGGPVGVASMFTRRR
jgi:hypothetical protein